MYVVSFMAVVKVVSSLLNLELSALCRVKPTSLLELLNHVKTTDGGFELTADATAVIPPGAAGTVAVGVVLLEGLDAMLAPKEFVAVTVNV